MSAGPVTDRIYLRDAQCRAFEAAAVAVDDAGRVALGATAFYATGGGQPHDTGTLAWEGGSAAVVDVRGHGPVEVSFWPRAKALGDAGLIRTKVNLIPEWVAVLAPTSGSRCGGS